MNRADFYTQEVAQMRLDYDGRTDGQPVYIGHAARGIASNQKGWNLQKMTYTDIGGTDFITLRQIANDSWDNRANASFA